MRLAGRITDWNDERGFGFVVPNGGGDRAFVHINAFQRGSRRPITGDLISYEASKDSKGRLNAKTIRFAGQKIEEPKDNRPLPRLQIALGFFVLLAIAIFFRKAPIALALTYFAVSVFSYALYYFDKAAAENGYRRTPESTLHFFDFLGGWPGALVAQRQFRHKTVKSSFQASFWITVIANLIGVTWLVASGTAQRISASLGGI